MQTSAWGPSTWDTLHFITFNYPINPEDKDKKLYLSFFKLVTKMLPCNICADSFKLFSKYIPLEQYLQSRYSVVYWLYFMHNLVNLKLNHPQYKFIDLILKYENLRANLNGKKIELSDEIIAIHNNTIMKYQDISYKRTKKMLYKNPGNVHINQIKSNIYAIET